MQNLKNQNTILVLGATGKTGSRVIERLEKLNVPYRAGSRMGTPKFDWEDRSTWAPILQDIHAVYISFQPDLAVPGAIETIKDFSTLAYISGVKKLVLLSGRGEVEAQMCEEAVMNSGADWTIVRASWFSQNFSEGNFVEQVIAGYVALPAGDVGEPFVDVDDIADVAVAALTQDGHEGKVYEVTGPELLTFKEAVFVISKAIDRPICYAEVSMRDYAEALTQYGVPAEVILLITYLFTEVLDGRNAHVTDGVKQALGREATSFAEFARKAAAAGDWPNMPSETDSEILG